MKADELREELTTDWWGVLPAVTDGDRVGSFWIDSIGYYRRDPPGVDYFVFFSFLYNTS